MTTLLHATALHDVSPDFSPSRVDRAIMQQILPHDATPRAIRKFAKLHRNLSDYGYWFLLGTLWVSYTGHSDINLWRRLFDSPRPNRKTSLMKPSELAALAKLPETLTVYRAHRLGETDWLAYTLEPEKAAFFAMKRNVETVSEYTIARSDALCLFLRRSEAEILALDTWSAHFVRELEVKAL